METTKTIKNIGKKCVASVLLGLTLLTSCGREKVQLPITPEKREKFIEQYRSDLELTVRSYRKGVESAEREFVRAIEDRFFTVGEQEKVYDYLDSAEKEMDRAIRLAKKARNINGLVEEEKTKEYSHLKMPRQYNRLKSLLDRNLYGIDRGTPNLERELEKEGTYVKVERCYTKDEKGSYARATLYVLILSSFLVYHLLKKIKKKREESEQKNKQEK